MNDFPLMCLLYHPCSVPFPHTRIGMLSVQCSVHPFIAQAGYGGKRREEQRLCADLAGALALCSSFLDFRKWSAVLGLTLPIWTGEKEESHSCRDALLLQIISPFSMESGGFHHHLILAPFFIPHFSRLYPQPFLLMLLPPQRMSAQLALLL